MGISSINLHTFRNASYIRVFALHSFNDHLVKILSKIALKHCSQVNIISLGRVFIEVQFLQSGNLLPSCCPCTIWATEAADPVAPVAPLPMFVRQFRKLSFPRNFIHNSSKATERVSIFKNSVIYSYANSWH